MKCDQQGICPNGCDANWEGEHCDNILKNFNSQLIGCMEFNKTSNDEYPRGYASSCIIACSGYGFTFAATKVHVKMHFNVKRRILQGSTIFFVERTHLQATACALTG